MPSTIRAPCSSTGSAMTRLSEFAHPPITALHAIAAASPLSSSGSFESSVAPAVPPVPTSIIAARLRWFRTERGLRLEDVAKRAGYTKGFLSKIEHGKASPPMTTLLRVAAALGVQSDVLFAPDAGAAPDA